MLGLVVFILRRMLFFLRMGQGASGGVVVWLWRLRRTSTTLKRCNVPRAGEVATRGELLFGVAIRFA